MVSKPNAAPNRTAVQSQYLSDVLEGVQRQREPHDRVLELARHSPALKAMGLADDFLDGLDLSDAGLAKTRTVLAPAKAQTVWEMGLVQPESKAWPPDRAGPDGGAVAGI